MKKTYHKNDIANEMQQAIVEGLKEQMASEISRAREDFCSKLMIAGLSAVRVKIVEDYQLVKDELQYSVSAIYRATGEPVDLSDIQLASVEDYDLWYAGLKPAVQAVVDALPPSNTYHLAGDPSPVQLYGYHIGPKGAVELTICVHDNLKGPHIMYKVSPDELTIYEKRT